MHALIVHAHPDPASFNAAMRDTAAQTLRALGHGVTISDLYADGFDPRGGPGDFTAPQGERFRYQAWQQRAAADGGFVPELRREIDRLLAADLVILQFPLWWFGLPAILKGWVDRVFAFGVAYGPGRSHATGPLAGKRAMLALTTGGPAAAYAPGGRSGELGMLLYGVEYGVLHFAGMAVLPRFVAWGAARVGDAERVAYLDGYAAHLRGVEALEPVVFTGAR